MIFELSKIILNARNCRLCITRYYYRLLNNLAYFLVSLARKMPLDNVIISIVHYEYNHSKEGIRQRLS